MKIQQKIEKIIPYIESDFLNFPLAEEGNFTPCIHFWLSVEDKKINHVREFIDKQENYTIGENEDKWISKRENIYSFGIYPKYDYCEKGSIKYKNPEYSIEEMLDIIYELIQKLKI